MASRIKSIIISLLQDKLMCLISVSVAFQFTVLKTVQQYILYNNIAAIYFV